MLNKIVNAVCKAIYDEFGDKYDVYNEKVNQGFSQPCFSVFVDKSENSVFLGKRYKSTNRINIDFYGGDDLIKRQTYNDITQRIPSALEYITVDGCLMHGTKLEITRGNNCFACGIDYDYFYYVRDEDDTELMQVLSVK